VAFGIVGSPKLLLICNVMAALSQPSKKNKADAGLKFILQPFEDVLVEGVFQCIQSKMVYANASFLKIFGYNTLEEIINEPVSTFYADEESRHYVSDFLESYEIITEHRVLCRRKDGKTFWGLLTGRKTHYNNKVYFDGSVMDISTLVGLEEALRQKQVDLEKLSMELDRFIYSASHDIRSPISTILGILNLMKIDFKDERGQEYITMMEDSMNRLDYFVKELVEYAKNSKAIVYDSPVNVQNILHQLLKEFKETHPAFSKISISLELNTPHVFYSDVNRLTLILKNVIKNALDYYDSHKGYHTLLIQVNTEPDKIGIEIFDNGVGIAAPHVSRVFEMFYRATHLSKGSGIGLYTVRDAVIKLAGVITINSEYGIGTSVTIEIPNSKKGRLINKKNAMRVLR
jgi:PAS domain S-box-containing protein